uniref:Uncharacterized protein n=1 Tax=uncultured Thiotrichaceae bacterium TaxID=298394 RepID=A0A6S6U1T0_9GAMM|nr:MAG: Unknown protein [uncultured Thiotrichaceae bacterium]
MNAVVESPSKEASEQESFNDDQHVSQAKNRVTGSEDAHENSGEENQSLDLVRNILFGEQVRQTEKRQASLEQHIQASVAALNEEVCKKIDALKGEVNLLTDLLEEESQTRKADVLAHQGNMSRVEQSIDKLGHQVLRNHSELGDCLENETNRLGTRMNDWREEILQKLENATSTLGHEKADRQSIAVLLTEMADQLVADESAAG